MQSEDFDRGSEREGDAVVVGMFVLCALSGILMYGLTPEAARYIVTSIVVYYAIGVAAGGTLSFLTPFVGDGA